MELQADDDMSHLSKSNGPEDGDLIKKTKQNENIIKFQKLEDSLQDSSQKTGEKTRRVLNVNGIKMLAEQKCRQVR